MVGEAQAGLLLLVVLCAPVLGGLAAFWVSWLAIAGTIVAWIGSGLLFLQALMGNETALSLGDWLHVNPLVVGLDFRLDLLAATLLLAMHSLVLAAQLLAVDYMREGVDRSLRLSSLLLLGCSLFCCADNYILLFAGWALLGLGVHFVAGADYAESGGVARIWIVLRSGDLVLFAGLVALCATGQVGWGENERAAQWIGLCLLLAAVVRSAQLPFQYWLVRILDPWALLQGYCTAIAGLYLLLRTREIWGTDPILVYVAAVCGLITALAGAVASIVARDVRSVLAYAISSQLGTVLVIIVCTDGRGAALHLAVFGVGMGLCLIGVAYLAQAEGEVWDVRTLGRWRRILPVPFWAVVLGALTISGVPPLAGAWSYAVLLKGLFKLGLVAWIGGCLLVFISALCVLRLLFLLVAVEEGEKPQAFRVPGGATRVALFGLGGMALAFCALGYPPGTGWFASVEGTLRWELLAGPGIAGLTGVLVAWLAYGDPSVGVEPKKSSLRILCDEGFYMESLARIVVGRPFLRFTGWLRDADIILFDLLFIEFSALGLRGAGWVLGRLQSGQVRFYAAAVLFSVLVALCYLTVN
ncbi:MAG TPA: hypothetical protein EYG11_03595 [Candidatus Latescibacteria bacterium]|nr:hypothetical protein [Candidatus Handelsmanbacteria bacterium]HIL07762.1 hypothetical protein [Candidatus Latescibacterota bacterium]